MKISITIFLVFVGGVSLYACTCGPKGILKKQKYAEVIFTGEVIEKIDITDENGDFFKHLKQREYVYVFRVRSVHKGRKSLASKKQIRIKSNDDYGMCDVQFELGKRYLVYSFSVDDKGDQRYLRTDICSGTKEKRFFTFLEQLILELT
ncbi:hypothetical protein [Maribacter sp. 2308TA10-17]|uniref:hypothetical protein n=1 Tax=Maribacter sp. 2308TA10-17 TaxID=3386276 RepID=UPI0039BD1293